MNVKLTVSQKESLIRITMTNDENHSNSRPETVHLLFLVRRFEPAITRMWVEHFTFVLVINFRFYGQKNIIFSVGKPRT